MILLTVLCYFVTSCIMDNVDRHAQTHDIHIRFPQTWRNMHVNHGEIVICSYLPNDVSMK